MPSNDADAPTERRLRCEPAREPESRSQGEIVPGQLSLANPDPNEPRWEPKLPMPAREVESHPSAFPPVRRFDTVYPGTAKCESATRAALTAAREHDKSATREFIDLLFGRESSS